MTLGAGSRHVHAVHRHTAAALHVGLDEATRTVVGGKGRAVAAMAAMGLPVPPAFCVTSEWCDECAHDPAAIVDRMWQDVLGGLTVLEQRTGCTFGAGPHPLLLSVRSSGVTSMPGMLDTVLNVGIDDAVADALGTRYSAQFAHDTRERFRRGYRRAVQGDAAVPDEPMAQLRGAIEAVASSWSSSRVTAYRAHHRLERGGIAILLQAMVFGNLDARSGTGVMFTRDPASGASRPFGEWLPAAQGDDVVSGTSDAEPLDGMRDRLPDAYDELIDAGMRLERLGADVQDVEFTVEAGRLWLLQSRVAKRSPRAAVRLAVAFHDEGVIDHVEVLRRVTPEQLAAALEVRSAPSGPPLATGAAACPGVASGLVCVSSDDAIEAADDGRDAILVRPTTSPDDVAGMMAAKAVVTEVGGASSHAAIVARELGIPAVVGCGVGISDLLAGRTVTVDGDAGEVRDGEASAAGPADDPELLRFAELVRSADDAAAEPLQAVLRAAGGGLG
ncbi:pyruvate, phosphate dikinase [Mycolicibacterium hodleri]|nr:pyruvate, phosphate dikinase [Mycolicibacterium hodleri]